MAAEHDLLPRAMSLAVHELRTPVTVVAGYLRMVLREQAGPINEKQRKMLDEAERSCARLAALVAEMSEFGKLESGELAIARQDVDLASLLTDVASGMHEGEDRGVTLELTGVDQPVIVTGDRARLTAALKALMHSALRERGEPGVITVQCRLDHAASPPAVVVAIGDAAELAAVHEPADAAAASFDEWRGGTGLALPVARRVMAAHGGAVWSAGGPHARAVTALRLPIRT